MHFMNNKREITSYKFDLASANLLSSTGYTDTHTMASLLLNNEATTNKDEYINKVIKKYDIYDNFDLDTNTLNFKFFDGNKEISMSDLQNILKFDNFYSFHYFGNATNYPFSLSLRTNDNYTYEYAFFTLANKYIKNHNIYVRKYLNSIDIDLSKGLIFVLNVKPKPNSLLDNKIYSDTIHYYSTYNNIKNYIKYANSNTIDLIINELFNNKSLPITKKPIVNGDIMKSLTENDKINYNTYYKISNLAYDVTLKPDTINNDHDLNYIVYHLRNDGIIDKTVKEEYIVKPNELFIFNLNEKIKYHTTKDIEKLSFNNWKKIPNTIIPSTNDNKLIPFYSINDMTFEKLNSNTITDNLLHEWKLINAESYEEKKEKAKEIMTQLEKYKLFIIKVRLVFYRDSESISYFYYGNDNGKDILLIKEYSTELTGKYMLLYPYYDKVNEDLLNTINISNNFDNYRKSVNLKFVSGSSEYITSDVLTGDVLISKIRIQTNANENIVLHNVQYPSWEIRKVFIWSDNTNLLLKSDGTKLVKYTSLNPNGDENSIINNLMYDDIQSGVYYETIKKSDNTNATIAPYMSGINENLDNGKQYIEINLEKPLLYKNIQQIFIQSGLNVENNWLTNHYEGHARKNINKTSLLFYDSNNNVIDYYSVDFSKVEYKDPVNNILNVDNIYLLKGPAYDSYTENAFNPKYENKPTTFITNYLTSEKMMKFEKANNINMKLVD